MYIYIYMFIYLFICLSQCLFFSGGVLFSQTPVGRIICLIMARYTQSPLEDSRLFGPSPWKTLTTTYEKTIYEQPSPLLFMETGCICPVDAGWRLDATWCCMTRCDGTRSDIVQDSSKGGAVETGCSGLHYIIGRFDVHYYPQPLHPVPTAPPAAEYPILQCNAI